MLFVPEKTGAAIPVLVVLIYIPYLVVPLIVKFVTVGDAGLADDVERI